ncbi:DMT family transporter [Streptomyces sp. DH8]|uniref:DMT family transporter n=1 Tax=Streptomyces sp. DH8 TaxID=2857008 RepID=UPI001E336C99|nr:DMT family transporter [Streptomyces sp. DH8]
MSSLALSVLLSLVSAVAYAAGAIIQERVAAGGDDSSRALLRNGVWWIAVVLNGAGAILHVVALAYGPLSLVQPLGALTIVFALPMAALFVGRRAEAVAWRGALLATVGLGGLLALTGDAEPHALNGFEQVLLASATFGAVALLAVFARTVRRPVLRSVVLAAGAGGAFGMASVFTKTVAVEWTSGSVRSGVLPLLAIAGLAAAGLFLSQAAYRGAGLTAPLATVTVVNPLVAAAIGITLFGEHFRLAVPGAVLALCCGALAAAGLVMLTRERLDREHAEEARAGTAGSGLRRAAPPGAPGAGEAVRAVNRPEEERRNPPSPPAPAPAPGTRAAPRPSPLPPGRAAPRLEPGAPGSPPDRRRTGATLRRPASAQAVQTLTPPARR